MFVTNWADRATADYDRLYKAAAKSHATRRRNRKTKSSKQEGLFKQVDKALRFLLNNPRHPSLQTHPYDSMENPFSPSEKVFEAYAQNDTPGAYRILWCYGPRRSEITILAITAHP